MRLSLRFSTRPLKRQRFNYGRRLRTSGVLKACARPIAAVQASLDSDIVTLTTSSYSLKDVSIQRLVFLIHSSFLCARFLNLIGFWQLDK